MLKSGADVADVWVTSAALASKEALRGPLFSRLLRRTALSHFDADTQRAQKKKTIKNVCPLFGPCHQH